MFPGVNAWARESRRQRFVESFLPDCSHVELHHIPLRKPTQEDKRMFCPSCGVAVAPNLTYCNHCGAKVNGEKTDSLVKTTEIRYEAFLIASIGGLFVTGLLAISVLIGVMKAMLHFDFGPLVGFALLSFLILLALEGVIISRLFRLSRRVDKETARRSEAHVTKELEAESRVPAEPIPSVTEHTTRTLDPIYNDRRS